MNRIAAYRWAIVGGSVALLEISCRLGWIAKKVIIPPTDMASRLWDLLASGALRANLTETFGNVLVALFMSLIAGFAAGAVIHALPRVRQAIDPFLASYYALPFFAFYPVLIVILGLGQLPIIAIGFLYAIVAMIVATLNGFDRIPRVLVKTASVYRMTPLAIAVKIKLPYAAPYIFTGVKLAVAYSFIGVIAAEFIMASSGLGYGIAHAFNSFDNRTMYALMLLVIVLVTLVNALFYVWEQRLLLRRGK